MISRSDMLKKPSHLAALSAFLFGLAVHLFGLVNVIHNHDNAHSLPGGYGAEVTSGRWFLSICGDIVDSLFGGYNLHFFNGLLFIVLISIAAGFVVSALDIRGGKRAVAAGMIFVSFPSTASILFYRFTSTYYGLSVLLAVLAAWVVIKYKWGIIAAPVFIALSLGLYQAFLPLTIGILLISLLSRTLDGEISARRVALYGLSYCAVLVAGLLLYYLCSELSLSLYGTELGSYKNIDEMGNISFSLFPEHILKAYAGFFSLPFDDYASLASIPILKVYYAVLFMVSLYMTVYLLIVKSRGVILTVFAVIFAVLFPLAVNFIAVMAPKETVYTLMAYPFVLFPLASLVFLDGLPEYDGGPRAVKKAMSVVLAVILAVGTFSYVYSINVSYTVMYYATKQTENYFDSLITQVRMTEGFTADKKWAFVGRVRDPLLDSCWDDVAVYGGCLKSSQLVNTYSRYDWINSSNGYDIQFASSEQVETVKQTDEFKSMPCWPAQGSVKVIGDIVVIKCQNE